MTVQSPRSNQTSESVFGSRLVVPSILSILLHVLFAAGAASWFDETTYTQKNTVHQGIPDDRVPSVDLGIAKSSAVTITWMGFESPTDHQAELSVVEQPELARASADVMQPEPLESAETPSPPEVMADSSSTSRPTFADVAANVVQQAAESVSEAAFALRPLVDGLLVLATRSPDITSSVETATGSNTGQQSKESSSQAASGADRDADATTIKRTLEIKPGQTLAAEGMEILTVRPRWLQVTTMTVFPRNPVVEIEFGEGGAVTAAGFQPGFSTGHAATDGPLLDAIYQWRARGPRVDGLGGQDRIKVTIRILLR